MHKRYPNDADKINKIIRMLKSYIKVDHQYIYLINSHKDIAKTNNYIKWQCNCIDRLYHQITIPVRIHINKIIKGHNTGFYNHTYQCFDTMFSDRNIQRPKVTYSPIISKLSKLRYQIV